MTQKIPITRDMIVDDVEDINREIHAKVEAWSKKYSDEIIRESHELAAKTQPRAVEPINVKQWVDEWVTEAFSKCIHPWHQNPGLITPCPECGEGSDDN